MCLISTTFCFSQSCAAIAYKAQRLSKVSRLNKDFKRDSTCRIGTVIGRVSGIIYEDGTSIEPIALVIQEMNGQRTQIGLDEDSINCLSDYDKSHYLSRLKKNIRVRIKFYVCGVGGKGDPQVSSIEFL